MIVHPGESSIANSCLVQCAAFAVLSNLQVMARSTELSNAGLCIVDRGHKHSNGCSEASFWMSYQLHRVNAANVSDAEEVSASAAGNGSASDVGNVSASVVGKVSASNPGVCNVSASDVGDVSASTPDVGNVAASDVGNVSASAAVPDPWRDGMDPWSSVDYLDNASEAVASRASSSVGHSVRKSELLAASSKRAMEVIDRDTKKVRFEAAAVVSDDMEPILVDL